MVNEPGLLSVILSLITGVIGVAGGFAIVRFRRSLHTYMVDRQKRIVGRSAGAAITRLQSPFWVGFVGVAAIGLGTTMAFFGAVQAVRLFG